MASLNKVILLGNLTRDPELRYTPSGTAVSTFGMAMNRRYRQESVKFWGATRWSKGNVRFRVDREVFINLVTQCSMRVQVPPSRCRSESISPRLETGPQRSEAGINGGI